MTISAASAVHFGGHHSSDGGDDSGISHPIFDSAGSHFSGSGVLTRVLQQVTPLVLQAPLRLLLGTAILATAAPPTPLVPTSLVTPAVATLLLRSLQAKAP